MGWRSAASIAIAVASACSSYGAGDEPTPIDPPADAGTDTTPEAAFDAPPLGRCDPTKPFGAAEIVAGVNHPDAGVQDIDGFLLPDERTIFFGSTRAMPPYFQLFVAVRDASDLPFGAPALAPGLTMPADSLTTPTLTPDGLTIYYDFFAGGAADGQIRRRDRANLAAAFSDPPSQGLGSVNTSQPERDPFLSSDALSLYFSRTPQGGDEDIYVATRLTTMDAFSAGVPVAELNTNMSDDRHPVLSPDGLAIYFSTNRGSAKRVIHVARRQTIASPFGISQPIAELVPAAGTFDSPAWVSADECVLYFTSNRTGTPKIYVARRGR